MRHLILVLSFIYVGSVGSNLALCGAKSEHELLGCTWFTQKNYKALSNHRRLTLDDQDMSRGIFNLYHPTNYLILRSSD